MAKKRTTRKSARPKRRTPPKPPPDPTINPLDATLLTLSGVALVCLIVTLFMTFVSVELPMVLTVMSIAIAGAIGLVTLFFGDRVKKLVLKPKLRWSSVVMIVAAVALASGLWSWSVVDRLDEARNPKAIMGIGLRIDSALSEMAGLDPGSLKGVRGVAFNGLVQNNTGNDLRIVDYSLEVGGRTYAANFHFPGHCASTPMDLARGDKQYIGFFIPEIESADLIDLGRKNYHATLVARDSEGNEWRLVSRSSDHNEENQIGTGGTITPPECGTVPQ